MEEWQSIKTLPDFNGKVMIRYIEGTNTLVQREAWYETGDRRFPEGFSLVPKYVTKLIIKWKKI